MGLTLADSLLVAGVQVAHAASLVPAARAFERALQDPGRAQRAVLARLVRANADTDYGVRHGFASIHSAEAYQRQVPIVDYDALEPWIARVAAGEAGVLTRAPVIALERSGGSTSTSKLIPYTRGLLAEFERATGPWLASIYAQHPAILGTRSYWSVSPAARAAETTAGGIPIGLEDDTDYFGPLTRWGLRRMMAVPATVAKIRDVPAWRLATIRRLVRARDLGFVSVWNPSFLTLLMEAIAAQLPELLAELAPDDRARVERALDREGRLTGEALWPRLAFISCWTDAGAAAFLPELRRWFPRTTISPKGLLATEGVISIPVADTTQGACLAVRSHFLEFIDLEARPGSPPLLADALRVGGSYSPLLSTSGGLYRYQLKDVVRVDGVRGRTPCIRFLGKLDNASDLCGEKLTEAQVAVGVDAASANARVALRFALLAPVLDAPPRYELYVDSDATDLALAHVRDAVEAYLATGHHYRYCRDLGQLAALSLVRVDDGARRYQEALVARGARAGDIKPLRLSKGTFWRDVFVVPGAPA